MFGWFKREPEIDENNELIDERVILHGYDLSIWHYLGESEVTYQYSDTNQTTTGSVYYFIKQDNDKVRRYVVVPHSKHTNFDHHPFITGNVSLWAACQRPWFECVYTRPSPYLKKRMLEEHSVKWDNDKSWWVSSEEAKYESAKKKQETSQAKETPNAIELTANVVKIEFGEKKSKDT